MRVLIAYDGSSHADAAIDDLRWAGLPADAEAMVMTAVEWSPQAPRTWGMVETGFVQHVEAAEEWGQGACTRLQGYFPKWNIQLETPTGHAAAVILEKASAWPAGLIAIGTHGRSGIARVVLGSVSSKVVREASCSVRVARPRRQGGPIRLLIGSDGSPEADAAVSEVCRRSWPAGTEARVVAVHQALLPVDAERTAISDGIYNQINEDERFRLRYAAREASERLRAAGLAVSQVVEEGEPKVILMREVTAWNADTLFIGARGLGRVERLLLGSVSSAVVTHAECTVEVVRPILSGSAPA